MKRSFLIFFIFILPLSLFANSIEEDFAQANAAYQAKDFAQAIQGYEKILAEGYQSVELYYNLGNSYFRQDELGRCILNYERALRLDPNDEDVQYNLVLVNQAKKDDIGTLPPFFLARWWSTLRGLFSASLWTILALVLLWTSIAGAVLWLKGDTRVKRKQGFLLAVIASLLCLLLFLLAYDKSKLEANSRLAIILETEVPIRNAPDEASTLLFELHMGTKVELLDKIGTWYKVRLMNGEQGWLPEDVLAQI